MNPILGVFFHWLGGFASGSFYVPFRGVKRWSWETAWLVAGVFSWILAPWFFALLNTTDVVTVLKETPGKVWFYAYLFGALWGFGGLTFGLTMRYLGMSLGMAVALGYCTVFGTLIPPLFKGEFVAKLIEPVNGRWVLAGLVVCMFGIAITAMAGRTKEGEMDAEQKRKTVKEFNFKKGILVATFSGIMSACFAFGLSAGDKIREITYKVDLVNSAAAAGKTAERTDEPTSAEVDDLITRAKLVDAEGEAVTSLGALVDLLEAPRTLQGRIDALRNSDAPDAAAQAGKIAKRAELEEKLSVAGRSAEEALGSLGRADDSELAFHLADYGRRFNAVTDEDVAGIVDNLSSFSQKQTALNVVDSGADLVAIHGKHSLWTGLPVLIVVLLGGFTTNFIWCVILNIRNRSGYEYLAAEQREKAVEDGDESRRIPRVRNYLFAALAGVTWYFQFFFYSMGETQMGEYKFSSWTLHMASIIIFSSLWGLFLGEWKGSSRKARKLLFLGLGVLILSTIVIGYGNYVGGQGGH
jgi:glucose uptake protein GlcU